jgi:Zn-dependent peptidase ImmA (M78 family)/transcriptional regulator with XRE-family HTH domain
MPASRSTSPLPFNPAIFRWARTRADFSQSEVAEKINVRTQKIIDWENQQSSPTVKQARDMAALYGRPFLEFFASAVPDIPETNLVPDFRMQHAAPIDHENRILRDVQAWGETQRLNAMDLFEINGEVPPRFPTELRAGLNDNQERVAEFARSILHFPIEQQLALRSQEKFNLVKIIRSKLEEIGILILKNSDLGKCNARGLCIYDELLPIIILSSETPNGSSFTLCHEFAHVILRQSAVSDVVAKSSNQVNVTEQWCNRFAGAFLMPYVHLINYIDPSTKLPEISDLALKNLASRFAVSMHAMLVRLVQLDIVEGDYYWLIKRPQFLEEEKKKQIARASHYGSRFRNRNGDMYTGLVLDAWTNNRISNHNAAEFMGIKNITHLFEIRNRFNDRE